MKLLAIDGNSILNRAYYAIKGNFSNREGVPTKAVFGFMNIYIKNIAEVRPDCVAVAFDLKKPTFRHMAVESYKANRKGMPDDLAVQLGLVKKILSLMGVKVVECEGYEADDILGTLARSCASGGHQCFILTGDRDSLQLLNENVTVILATNDGDIIYTPEKFREDYGFEPLSLIDYKAICGDKSDNISGIRGIGEKTASSLIKEYGTIENIYADCENLKLSPGMKKKISDGRSDAEQSKWLATIVSDAPIETEVESYRPNEPDNSGLFEILTELELRKIIEKLDIHAAEEFEPVEISEKELTSDDIENFGKISYIFDGAKLSVRSGNVVYNSESPEIICRFLSSPCEKITDSSKMHYRYAIAHGCNLSNLSTDISICGYLLDASSDDYSTERMCAENGVHYYSENEPYADLVSLGCLAEKLRELIESEGLLPLLEKIEMPLTEVLASMEEQGVKVDREGVEAFGEYLSTLIEETEKAVFAEVGHEFKILSPKQLGAVLFDELHLPASKKTKTGYSTSADVLEELRSSSTVVENVLKYRQYTKLKSTYVVGLLDKISEDGRIHTSFRQTETRTGRISSTEPNLQNIPVRTELGSQMRKFFTAENGRILIDADYSQIELRVMAHMSGDKNMIRAFNSGEDIHTSTASQVFDVPAIMVTPEMRSAAKAVNFGIIYGIGDFSLSKDINVSREEAKEYIESYLANFPSVDDFMKKTVSDAEKTGVVFTMFGRKRRIPEILSSNRIAQKAGQRIAMNTPVQGTAADLIKIAMINVYRRLKAENLSAELILQVHDELIIESDVSCAERCAEILKEEMMNVCEMKVPLAVDVNKGASWYDAKG